jgi:UDP-glucose 4-epimerase
MFDFRTVAFRFGNVVGPRQTHGVGFDFIRQLMVDPTKLKILGDGEQSKSYVYIDDIVSAVLTANTKSAAKFNVFNVATGDYITVTEIGELACDALGISKQSVDFVYSGGTRGWKGDVPVVRLSSDRIREIGWLPKRNSGESLFAAMQAMASEPRTSRK